MIYSAYLTSAYYRKELFTLAKLKREAWKKHFNLLFFNFGNKIIG